MNKKSLIKKKNLNPNQKMVCSLHSHSGSFCKHARGTLEEVVLKAIELGFKTYGLSEHMPRYREQDLYPEEKKLKVEDLSEMFDAYVKEARSLQLKYKDQIKLLVGMETENIYDQTIDQILELHRKHNFDYLVGSVHHVAEMPIDFSRETFQNAVTELGGLDRMFQGYFDLQLELLERVKPEVIGHFDLINMFCFHDVEGEKKMVEEYSPIVWEKIVRNVKVGIQNNALFELNSSAFRKALPGAHPQSDIVQLIKSHGGKFTLSDDSHGPLAVGMNYHLLLEYLQKIQITVIYVLERDEQTGKVVHKEIQDIQNHTFWNVFRQN